MKGGDHMGYYHPALICQNGHVITTNANDASFSTPYCSKCGASTISSCPRCNHQIDGKYEVEGVLDLTGYTMQAPAFCPYCGKAFPWTETALQTAIELINESDSLTDSDKALFSENISDTLSETPKTKLATVRIDKVLRKAGTAVATGVKDILVEICAESVKRVLFP